MTCTVNVDAPDPVGVPEMTPLLLRLSPVGSVPDVNVQVNGDVPPLFCSDNVNAVPVVAVRLGNAGMVTTGVGATAIVVDADLLVSATEVAVIVAVTVEAPEDGALYVTDVVVAFVNVPPPETAHVTPRLLESLATVAENVICWP